MQHGPQTILLVEDEPAIRRLIASALERAGYRVVQAPNAPDALTAFDETIDLLVTDMRLPYVSGAELIEQLRARRQTLKVVTISGHPMNAVPGILFLAKPFTRDDLLTAIRDVLDDERPA